MLNQKFLPLILILTLTTTGCEFLDLFGDPIENSLEEQGINLDLENGSLSWQTTDESTDTETEIDTSLPSGWPTALSTYPDAEITESYTKISQGTTTSYLELSTTDSPYTTHEFYRGVLTAAGFTITSNTSYRLQATKDTQTIQITSELQGDHTTIQLTLTY